MPVVAWRERNFLLLLLLPKNLPQEINYTERTRYTRVKQHLLGCVCVCERVRACVLWPPQPGRAKIRAQGVSSLLAI